MRTDYYTVRTDYYIVLTDYYIVRTDCYVVRTDYYTVRTDYYIMRTDYYIRFKHPTSIKCCFLKSWTEGVLYIYEVSSPYSLRFRSCGI